MASTLRQVLALIVPVAVLIPLVALDASNLVWGYGAASTTYSDIALALALFSPGLVLFTSHYLVLRGFYALERTRTVFWVQCVDRRHQRRAGLRAHPATRRPASTAAGLVLAYCGAYLVGAVGSYLLLRHVLGGLETPGWCGSWSGSCVAVGLAALVGWGVRARSGAVLPGDGKRGRPVGECGHARRRRGVPLRQPGTQDQRRSPRCCAS